MPPATSAAHGSRPNPSAGVFETILVVDGRPVELGAHLDRLGASLRSLYGEIPPGLAELVVDAARGGRIGRLRLTVEPTRDGSLASSVVVAPFDPYNVFPTGALASALQSYVLRGGGWGDHKWADREVLARAEAAVGPGAAPLLVDEAGVVLEASRANVFLVSDGILLTPPLDGAILPGVARAGVIAEAADLGIEVREERVGLDLAIGADEIFLTNALRGVEPVQEIDGAKVDIEGPVTTALAAALRRRWELPAVLPR
jgi:para-aminobenzoate synthetase/4-amino-4-deoxychorismate lyase